MKRFIAFLISAVMLISLVPTSALADPRIEIDDAAKIGSTYFDSFDEAVSRCGTDDIIILLSNAEYSIKEGDCFTVNKNGYTLTVTASEGISFIENKNEETGYSTYSELRILGDVDRSGDVDVVDCSMIRHYAVGLVTLDSEQKELADVNGDGAVNVIDVNLVRRYIVNLISQFPTV